MHEELVKLLASLETELDEAVSSYYRESILNKIKDAIEVAYKLGRDDERYYSRGPVVNMYPKGESGGN